ncbi:EamA family transporter RarD [Thermasporomyces composti]|uniref:Chloramphenicol-sensitive protein RarD n=1 Tax=Thermasporomyces composti TaxID=696763 RepID=A0A3D9V8V4_THECX|nr:EamA family transporter RarD [Thermasporomyces composti]REF37133.1 chloramphenicol-sensitive protein RarD [Thermasporomyces composti]
MHERHARGLVYGASAYLIWGIFPVYWPLLEPAGSLEILAHRMLWTLVFVALLLCVRPRPNWWSTLRRQPRSLAFLAVAALVVTANWGTFIWAVNHGHVVETALGYFINPLVTVLVGVVVLGERLNRAQWCALAIAGLAVVVLTVDYGRPPWVAFALAFSFSAYALCKKQANAGAVESLAVETATVAPLALGYLTYLEATDVATFGHAGWVNAALLAGTGVVTAIPLLLFGAAATRVTLTAIGLLQYIGPTLQFLIGVLVFREPMPPERLAGFAIVWVALVIFTWDGLRRRTRRDVTATTTQVEHAAR